MRRSWTEASDEFVQREVAEQLERDKVLLRTGPKQIGSTEVVIEDVNAAEWLAGLQKPDGGGLLVPSTLGQNATWELVKDLPGCPSQTLVRKAQADRKVG